MHDDNQFVKQDDWAGQSKVVERPFQSFKPKYEPIPAEALAAAKADWLTGQFNTEQLSERHKIMRTRLISYMRFQWTKEAKELGITPAKEPKLPRKSYGRGTWNKARLDFMEGKEWEEISTKYKIPVQHLKFIAYRRGWPIEKEKVLSDQRKLVSPGLSTSLSKTAKLDEHYDGVMLSAMEQIDLMSVKLREMIEEKTCTPEKLKCMIESLGGIVALVMKICGKEKPTTQVNQQFIRLNVLDDGAAENMNQLAKTINLKAS